MVKNPELLMHGITEVTPKNILLGAGTIFKNLTWDTTKSQFKFDKVLGATSGGSKFSIKNEFKDIEADGAVVKVKGLTLKYGQVAELETNLLDITVDNLKIAMLGEEKESEITGYKELVPKAQLEAGDYIGNLAYVGRKSDGSPVIIIMENALCTEGLEIEGKNKDNAVLKVKFECYGDITSDLQTLPVKILIPEDAQKVGQ